MKKSVTDTETNRSGSIPTRARAHTHKHTNTHTHTHTHTQVTIGGYFIIAQMLSYVQALVSLDLSHSHLKPADARLRESERGGREKESKEGERTEGERYRKRDGERQTKLETDTERPRIVHVPFPARFC